MNRDADQERQDRLDQGEVDVLLQAATRAPSLHNSQPWTFAVGLRHIEVYADAARQLESADPTGRSLLVSCGAAVLNLRVAAAHLMLRPRVRLLPDHADRTLVAVLELERTRQSPGELQRYFPALAARRTNRRPFEDRTIAAAVLASLVDAARAEGAVLHVFDAPDEVARIVDLLHDADLAERANARRLAERRQWVAKDSGDDGIPSSSLGPRPVEARTPYRDLGGLVTPRDYARFEAAPTLAVLSTAADRALDWVRAGQALERVLLEATVAGLSASFMNQPLEQHDLRWQVRNPLTGIGHSHMILRLGYGESVPASPRRPLEAVTRSPRLMP